MKISKVELSKGKKLARPKLAKKLKAKNSKNLDIVKKLKNLTKSKKPDFTKVNNFFSLAFFISKTKLVFTQLKQAFTETLILYHFDLKHLSG